MERQQTSYSLVYYGTPGSGKTTSLTYLFDHFRFSRKSTLRITTTETERIIAFRGTFSVDTGRHLSHITMHVTTISGAALFYQTLTTQLLQQADGVIFVSDAWTDKLSMHRNTLDMLVATLTSLGRAPAQFPCVMQYNKRDLPEPQRASIFTLNQVLNPYQWPFYESIALDGIGVLEPFFGVLKQLLLT